MLRMTIATCHRQTLKNTRSLTSDIVQFCTKNRNEHLIQEFVAVAANPKLLN